MTLLLSYKSIYKTYGEDHVFEDLSVSFKTDERLGLIGGNGSGKSTLLKLAAGEASPDSGESYIKNLTKLVYLPQEDQLTPEKTVEESLFESLASTPLDDQEKYRRVQRMIGMGGVEDKSRKAGELSGGWKKRLAIARALIQEPDLLLLDEPTNHLDINGIMWLEDMLKNSRFAFVVVSHDRYFLENVCRRIMELGKCFPEGHLSLKGGYRRFVKHREAFLATQLKKEEILSNKMRRETEWLNQGAKARSTKAKYRIDQAEALRRELARIRYRNSRTGRVDIDFHSTDRKTRQLLTCHNIGKSIQGKKLFEHVSLKLMPGVRLGLMGPNGSGKTTFMNLLENRDEPDEGTIKRAESLRIAVFDQNRSRLDPEITLKQALSPAGDSLVYKDKSVHVVTWAKRFLFTPDQLTLPVRRLSGGEKARILIAELMRQPADILLLDEPTNDLDIPSLEVLEESLLDFPGAVVVVSHDRFLLDRVTTSILFFNGQGEAGLFADFHQCLDNQQNRKKNKEKKTGNPPAQSLEPLKKDYVFSYKHKFELEHMEKTILQAEAEAKAIQEEMENPATRSDPQSLARVCNLFQDAQERVDGLYARWEELENLKNFQTK